MSDMFDLDRVMEKLKMGPEKPLADELYEQGVGAVSPVLGVAMIESRLCEVECTLLPTLKKVELLAVGAEPGENEAVRAGFLGAIMVLESRAKHLRHEKEIERRKLLDSMPPHVALKMAEELKRKDEAHEDNRKKRETK